MTGKKKGVLTVWPRANLCISAAGLALSAAVFLHDVYGKNLFDKTTEARQNLVVAILVLIALSVSTLGILACHRKLTFDGKCFTISSFFGLTSKVYSREQLSNVILRERVRQAFRTVPPQIRLHFADGTVYRIDFLQHRFNELWHYLQSSADYARKAADAH